jgi:predicted Holliday junction resolvase-like endonuclease
MKTLTDLHRARGLHAKCPSCGDSFSLRKARLFDATKPLPAYARLRLAQERDAIVTERQQLRAERAELQRRSFMSTASSGIGQRLEMVAASLPAFPTASQDCRALLKPLDYLAFVGAAAGKVEAIRFIEVKTGRQRLSKLQRAIKTAVEGGAVKLRVADHQVKVK